MSRVAIVVVSLGDRPWWPIALRWLEHYCLKCSYDLVVVRQPLVAHLRPADFDRFQNFGRTQKLGIRCFFDIYDRVIQVDDTCMISPTTPPLADIVPEDAIGCWVAGPGNAKFASYIPKHKEIYGRATPLPATSFYNSGLSVYSKNHASLFEQASIPWDKIRSDHWFPTQGYLSDRAEQEGIALHDLGSAFNLIGSRILSDPSIQSESVFIYHLTSALRDRLGMAVKIDSVFREKAPLRF